MDRTEMKGVIGRRGERDKERGAVTLNTLNGILCGDFNMNLFSYFYVFCYNFTSKLCKIYFIKSCSSVNTE